MPRNRSCQRAAGLLAIALLAAPAPAQTITPIGTWGPSEAYGDSSSAAAVNADGTVVVGWTTALSRRCAVRWTPAGISDLGVMQGYPDTWATAVSWDGLTIVGNASVQPGYWNGRPFLWTWNGGMQPIGPAMSPQSGFGVSADGSVMVGSFYQFPTVYMYRWTSGGGLQNLGILNGAQHTDANGISGDGLTIVGHASLFGGGWKPVRWTQASGIVELPPLESNMGAAALAASYDGSTIVGISYVSDNEYLQAVRWTGAGVEPLGLPPNALGARALAVSADGSTIVGDVSPWVQVTNDAWIWTETRGFTYLHEYLPAEGVDLSGWSSLDHCAGISADGTALVGSGTYQGLRRGFVVRGLRPVCGAWILDQPQNAAVCAGGETSLSVTAYGPTFQFPTLQWYAVMGGFWFPVNDGTTAFGTVISGATTPVLNFSNCAGDVVGAYVCYISAGCAGVATNIVSVVMNTQPPNIVFQPADAVVCPDGSASFSVTIFNNANDGPFYHQWQREAAPNVFVNLNNGYTTSWDGNNPGVGGIVSGATTATLTIAADTANSRILNSAHSLAYRCLISNACFSVPSALGGLKAWSSCNSADMNGDQTLDFFDIDPFLLVLFNPAAFAEQYPLVNPHNADCNGDDVVDFFDIDPFLACLFGACP